MTKIHDKPSDVVADSGVVLVDGPDGVSVSLTPRAASVLADRLHRAADEAVRQDSARTGGPGAG